MDKSELIAILTEVADTCHTDRIKNIIKEAALDLNYRKLMQTMMDVHREVLEKNGYDGFEALLDCMEAIDKHIEDQDIMKIVTFIRQTFKQA